MTQRVLAIGLAMVGLAVGCSLLTKPEQSPMRCEIDEDDEGRKVDPCPEGLYCLKGVCQPEDCKEGALELCEEKGVDDDCDGFVDEENDAEAEICDTRDNDCDGKFDENFDEDDDKWTWCGTKGTRATGTFDCEPAIKEVNPDGKETCDGLDNDCLNGVDDEPDGGSLCEGGRKCVNGTCETPSCATPDSGVSCKTNEKCIDAKCVVQACSPACKLNEFCDMPSLTCMPVPPKKVGAACSLDDDCDQSGVKLLCFERLALDFGPGTPRGICSVACCNDADCGANETCYVSGTGTRACLPKQPIANGTSPARCTLNDDCVANKQACGVAVLDQFATTVCRTPAANERQIGELCGAPRDCRSKLCVDGNFLQQLCTAPCEVSSDCEPLKDALMRSFGTGVPYCDFVDLVESDPKFARNFAPICKVARANQLGAARNGAECAASYECASGVCVGASSEGKGRCAETCCTDSQCTPAAAGSPALRCRPVVRGLGRYEMRCLAR